MRAIKKITAQYSPVLAEYGTNILYPHYFTDSQENPGELIYISFLVGFVSYHLTYLQDEDHETVGEKFGSLDELTSLYDLINLCDEIVDNEHGRWIFSLWKRRGESQTKDDEKAVIDRSKILKALGLEK